MIKLDKLIDIEGHRNGKRLVQVSLIADTKEEVIANGIDCVNIVGLNATDEIVFGSDCLTVNKEFGMLDSLGNWKF